MINSIGFYNNSSSPQTQTSSGPGIAVFAAGCGDSVTPAEPEPDSSVPKQDGFSHDWELNLDARQATDAFVKPTGVQSYTVNCGKD